MTAAHTARIAALVGAALAGAVIAISVQGGPSAPAAPAPQPLATATVVRTNLVSSVLTGGTLGYGTAAPVVNQLSGTYTALPHTGARIAAGGDLYRVDNIPVTLMAGPTPAWRAFGPRMTDGPDVAELQANLISLGYAAGLFSVPTGHFDAPTAEAVEQWQTAQGARATGEVSFGEIVFLPELVRVGAESFRPGEAAARGQQPYQVTTTSRRVTVPLGPNLPAVHIGEKVTIVLPSGARARGTVTAVGPPPPTGSRVSTVLTVTPSRSVATGPGATVAVEVSLTTQSVRNVLAVPVSALLALAGGGYGLEIVEPSGAHKLTGVRTGMFSGSQVQVRGAEIRRGTRVVVAQ